MTSSSRSSMMGTSRAALLLLPPLIACVGTFYPTVSAVISISNVGCGSSDSGDVESNQASALLDLKTAWGLDSNPNFNTWKQPGGTWSGTSNYVGCDYNGNVIVLTIQFINLNAAATLPASLSKLTSLRALRLPNINISGSIPESFSALSSLIELTVNGNQLTSVEGISGLSNLLEVDFQHNLVATLPTNLRKLTSLTAITMTGNLVTTFPAGFYSLSKLIILNAPLNQIRSFGPSTIDLPHLNYLDLSHNNLTYIPRAFSTMTTLETLELSYNNLKYVNNLRFMLHLPTLKLKHNNITNMSPILGMIFLKSVDLSYNNIKFLPRSLGRQKLLSFVDLSANPLKYLPRSFLKDTSLTNLVLNLNTGFKRNTLELYTGLTNLATFINKNNNITGTIPSTFSSLKNLRNLDISGNQFSENYLPSTISALTNLQTITLFNMPSITLPAVLGGVTRLATISTDSKCPSDGSSCVVKQHPSTTFCQMCTSFCSSCTN